VGQLRTHPWPHLLVDDFLASDILARSLTEVNYETYDYEIEARGSGRIEFSLLKSESLWRAIYSRNTVTLLNSAFTAKVRLNKQNYVQLRRMNDETPDFPIRNDFVTGSETIASFLYLSAGWSAARGGRLNLFTSEDQHGPCQSIEPIQNRFVAFCTKSSHWIPWRGSTAGKD
jgi:hypothetical protein